MCVCGETRCRRREAQVVCFCFSIYVCVHGGRRGRHGVGGDGVCMHCHAERKEKNGSSMHSLLTHACHLKTCCRRREVEVFLFSFSICIHTCVCVGGSLWCWWWRCVRALLRGGEGEQGEFVQRVCSWLVYIIKKPVVGGGRHRWFVFLFSFCIYV